jgi:hypothetical protein
MVFFLLSACTPASGGGPDEVVLPKCNAVWVPRASLPADYIGCQEHADGYAGAAFTTPCRSGPDLYFFEMRFWGWPGGRIHVADDAAEDPAYPAAWRRCRGYS